MSIVGVDMLIENSIIDDNYVKVVDDNYNKKVILF